MPKRCASSGANSATAAAKSAKEAAEAAASAGGGSGETVVVSPFDFLIVEDSGLDSFSLYSADECKNITLMADGGASLSSEPYDDDEDGMNDSVRITISAPTGGGSDSEGEGSASDSANQAAQSATAAAQSASDAAASAEAAADSETAAETAAGTATSKAAAAADIAATATNKANAASESASAAASSATEAANSATAAATSKNQAAGEASAAGASATLANNKANAASESASAAATSATNAANSARAAAASATVAETAAASIKDEVPDYVKTEAERVANLVQSRQGASTITVLACSDIHHSTVNYAAQMGETLAHLGQGMKLVREQVAIDFAACLGDSIWDATNETVENVQAAAREVNAAIFHAFNGIPNFRLIGNHEAHYNGATKLTASQIFANTAAFNAGAVFGEDRGGGYCYRDFEDRKLRVVCMNTSESDESGGYTVSSAQLEWLAEVLNLASLGDGWKSVILSHIPLDWYGSSSAPLATVKAANGVLCNVHGHIHNYLSGTLEGTSIPRFAIPNACFYRSNEYGENGATEYNGMEFGETTTYSKTAGTANDTAFCVVTLDLDNLVAYADRYGAGYDRVVDLPQQGGGYTNLVPTAQAIDSTAAYNGTGYKNGYYLSSTSPFEGTDSATVLTGYIPYNVPETGIPPTIYIKGAEWQSISHCRWFGFDSTKTATKGCQIQGSGSGAAALTSSFTVTQLGDDYFSLEPILSGSNWAMTYLSANSTDIEFFRVSLVGTGENLIITLDEPIE